MNLLIKYMSGVDILNMNYYIEELKMVLLVRFFMKNVTTKDPQFAYIKMIRVIFLEDMPLFLGKKMAELALQKIVLYLL